VSARKPIEYLFHSDSIRLKSLYNIIEIMSSLKIL
jgi:hypothetical protein